MSDESKTTGPLMVTPASRIDHTLLKPDATGADIAQLCEEAVEHGFASVCVPPSFVAQAAERLYGSEVAVGTVIGFPLGYETSLVKAFATERAVAAGAAEVDMVIHLGDAREGRFERILTDIRQVVAAADKALVKVIIECCLFEPAVKRQLAETVARSGAHYVKTSTGFAAAGATAADLRLLATVVAGRVRVKASGGIRDWPTCREMLLAGADRIGSSSGPEIVAQWRRSSTGGK